MHGLTRISVIAMVGGLVVCSTVATHAKTPSILSNGQLDSVTAGNAATVGGTADAQSTGALSIATTSGNSFVVQGASPYPGQPEFGPTGGMNVGTALAVGSNLAMQGLPPPSSGTSVTTGGAAYGNQVINTTSNYTSHGAGGVTFQVGWTFVYGAWVGF